MGEPADLYRTRMEADALQAKVDATTKMFGNQALKDSAALLARVHPYAGDYIQQAPALALAATFGGRMRLHKERARIAQWFGTATNNRPQLKKVMAYYKLPLPMRAITGGTLCPSDAKIVALLSAMNPSTLAQIIPKVWQTTWMRALRRWVDTVARYQRRSDYCFEWAAREFSGLTPKEMHTVGDLADFACSAPVFNKKWTRATATARMGVWHLELARKDGEKEFLAAYGIEFDALIDYRPFPLETTVDGFTFRALNSGSAIYEEGAAMHHCVRTYSGFVVHGQSRLFSIRDAATGHRVATMECSQSPSGRYVGRQLSGPCNAPPPVAVKVAAMLFLKQHGSEPLS